MLHGLSLVCILVSHSLAHKTSHPTTLHLREKVPLREDDSALRALSMEWAHVRLNFLLIEMGWYWSLPDAFAEQGGGDVLQNRIRAKLQVCQTLIFV